MTPKKDDELVVVEYDGRAGSSVSNAFGTWDINAGHGSEQSPVKDISRADLAKLGPMFSEVKKKSETHSAKKK